MAVGFKERRPAVIKTGLAILKTLPQSCEVLVMKAVGNVLLGDPAAAVELIKTAQGCDHCKLTASDFNRPVDATRAQVDTQSTDASLGVAGLARAQITFWASNTRQLCSECSQQL